MFKAKIKLCAIVATALTVATISGCAPASPRTQQYTNPQAPAPVTPAQPNRVAPVPQTPVPPAQVQNRTQMREAQNIADTLAGKHNIDRATVFVTDRTCYVAVNIPNAAQTQLTDQIKNEVANEVRRVDPSIQQVYISADPAVFQRFQGYSNDIRAGRPIQGIYDRFSEMVQRIFPQQR